MVLKQQLIYLGEAMAKPNPAWISLQNYLPQHLITAIMGRLAGIRKPLWLKNWMINHFIKKYQVDMSAAILEKPQDYPDFNHFFIRQLKPNLRPLAKGENDILSPVDGCLAQIGTIKQNQLLQAKNFYYNLETLLGGDTELAKQFYDGAYATLYLAPRDYHRVHMPLSGSLVKSIYVPGSLFSVNRMTSEIIPNLFSRNERLITVFNTAAGPMAVILVGAMIVGNIQTVWMDKPIKSQKIIMSGEDSADSVSASAASTNFAPGDAATKATSITNTSAATVANTAFIPEIHLRRGAELGHFTLGSTVILLFGKNKVEWAKAYQAGSVVKFGEQLGSIS
jgi:phosphatidylserine decarboxylase